MLRSRALCLCRHEQPRAYCVACGPQAAETWSDSEVAERWVRLFPVRVNEVIDEDLCQEKVRQLQGNPERMAELRSRLGSLS